MIIDGHSHGMHGGYLDQIAQAGGEWARARIDRMRASAQRTPQSLDVALRVRQLDEYGYDKQMMTSQGFDPNVFPGDIKAKLALARAVNDNMARLMDDSKGRLVAGGAIPMTSMDQGGRQEIERAIRTLGLRAINLSSQIDGKPLDSPEIEPFWDVVDEMDVPVYIHPVFYPGRSYEDEFDLAHILGWPYETALTLARLVFSGVMERHPHLRILSHHLGGGMIPFFEGRIIESNDPTSSWQNLSPQMPNPLHEYFRRFYYDSAVGGSAAAIKCALEVFGVDQIVFATDAPNGPGKGLARMESYPRVVKSLGLSAENTEKILSGNARRLLNLA